MSKPVNLLGKLKVAFGNGVERREPGAWRREHKRTAERDTGEEDMIKGGRDAIIDFVVV